jgi:hypothetical protein
MANDDELEECGVEELYKAKPGESERKEEEEYICKSLGVDRILSDKHRKAGLWLALGVEAGGRRREVSIMLGKYPQASFFLRNLTAGDIVKEADAILGEGV